MKESETFIFAPLINNSVNIGLDFLLLSITAIILSNTMEILCFLFGLQYFHKYHSYYLDIQSSL